MIKDYLPARPPLGGKLIGIRDETRSKPTDEALRAAAIKAIAKVSCHDKTCCCPQTFSVPDHGTIHRTERFAFVEAVIAVPLQEDGSIQE